MVSRLRIIVLAVALVLVAITSVLIELRSRDNARKEMRYYAHTVAPLLWEVNEETTREYLDLMLSMRTFHSLRTEHDDGELFAQAESQERPNMLERTLRSAGLIRDQVWEYPISYQGIVIGRVVCAWTNRNIYIHLALLASVAIAFSLLFLLDYSRQSRLRRKAAEEELSESRTRLHTVVSGAPVILFALDRKGEFALAEGKGLETLGLKQNELVGHSIADVDTRSPISRKDFQRALSGETFVSRRATEKSVFESWHSPLRDAKAKIRGVIGVSTDITNLQKAMTSLEERDRKMRHEMGLARSIHRALMPNALPRHPGFDFAMLFVPSGDIGGDFIDFVPLKDTGQLGIAFADITGHGVPAALLAAMFKVLMNDVASDPPTRTPAHCMATLNRRVGNEFPANNFVSAFYLVIDSHQRRITYVNASQEPGLLFRSDGSSTLLQTGGPALGIIPADDESMPPYEEGVIQLEPGDLIFLYTDGLVEIENERGESLGRERLIRWIQDDFHSSPQSLIDRIYARMIDYAGARSLEDDLAIVIAKATLDSAEGDSDPVR